MDLQPVVRGGPTPRYRHVVGNFTAALVLCFINTVAYSGRLRLLPPDQVRGRNDTSGRCHCEEQSDETISSVTHLPRGYVWFRTSPYLRNGVLSVQYSFRKFIETMGLNPAVAGMAPGSINPDYVGRQFRIVVYMNEILAYPDPIEHG